MLMKSELHWHLFFVGDEKVQEGISFRVAEVPVDAVSLLFRAAFFLFSSFYLPPALEKPPSPAGE